MSLPMFSLKEADFLAKYDIEPDQLVKLGIKWDELVAIANDHCANYSNLQPVANYVTEKLRRLSDVHTLRIRIKDSEHLIEKIIRKQPSRTVPITRDNYQKEITDLIGIRALHLFKDQWKTIHDFVTKNWDTCEQPTAYLRKGDSPKLVNQLADSGCKIEYHPYGYRSVHYLIKVTPDKNIHIIELQVRTVFEEGWSEIDHLVRYPNHSKDERLDEFLVVFNRLAGSADEMGSFIKYLRDSLSYEAVRFKKMEQQLKDKERDAQNSEEALKQAVARLSISTSEKEDLQKRIDELTEKRQAANTWSFPSSDIKTDLHAFGTNVTTGLTKYPLGSVENYSIFTTVPNWTLAGGTLGGIYQKVCETCGRSYIDQSVIISKSGKIVCPDCRSGK